MAEENLNGLIWFLIFFNVVMFVAVSWFMSRPTEKDKEKGGKKDD